MDDPKMLLGEQTPPAKPLAGSLSLFDINLLPERYRRRKFRFVAFLPWLVFIILLGALYPATISALEARTVFMNEQIEFIALQTELSTYENASLEIESILTELENQNSYRDQILASYQGLDLIGSNWSQLLFLIEDTTPPGITWTLISQQENEIRLDGIAENYPTILILVDSIAKIDQVSSIQIQSVDQVIDEDTGLVPVDNANQIQSYTFTLLAYASGEGVK